MLRSATNAIQACLLSIYIRYIPFVALLHLVRSCHDTLQSSNETQIVCESERERGIHARPHMKMLFFFSLS